jgi:hypothetical protein
MSHGTGRDLDAACALVVLVVFLATQGMTSAAAAFDQPKLDDWWRPASSTDLGQPTTYPTQVFGIGDSVMLGASAELERAIPGIEIDAVVGRQASTGIDILRARAAAGLIPDVVIFGLGTNGPLTSRELDEAMDALSGLRRVVIVNNSMPRNWEAANNALLADTVQHYPNTMLVDWHALTMAQPGLLVADGIHLQASGAQAYAALVAPAATAPLAS